MKETNDIKNPSPVSDRAKALGVLIPAAVVCLGFVVGLAWFARPAVSETEKRELTRFPTFTVDSFLSGEFTDQVSLWYADTFPGREGIIGGYHGVQSLFGFRGEQFQIGVGDDVPDGPMGDFPVDRPLEGGEGGEQVGGYYLSAEDKAAYELYAFSDEGARRYAAMINRAEQVLDGKAVLYDMIVPLHYSLALGAEVQDSMSLPDGGKTIDYIYSGLSDSVRTVDAFGSLMAHRGEYLYFRTDHHWTATGAYYAYEAFCKEAGIAATPLGAYEKLAFEGFLGTLYSKTGQPAALAGAPDIVEAYVPRGTNRMVTHQADGTVVDFYSIVNRQTDSWYQAAASKYNCFVAGDHPLIEIHNESIAAERRGTSILLVKESFGNAFAPFLVDSYEYVYIIDYRYYEGTLADFVSENGVREVLFLNNIVATTAGARIGEMERFVD